MTNLDNIKEAKETKQAIEKIGFKIGDRVIALDKIKKHINPYTVTKAGWIGVVSDISEILSKENPITSANITVTGPFMDGVRSFTVRSIFFKKINK